MLTPRAYAARVRAGLAVEHNEIATRIFCGLSPEDAKKVTDDVLIDLPEDGYLPAFEVWRQRIAGHFAARAESADVH